MLPLPLPPPLEYAENTSCSVDETALRPESSACAASKAASRPSIKSSSSSDSLVSAAHTSAERWRDGSVFREWPRNVLSTGLKPQPHQHPFAKRIGSRVSQSYQHPADAARESLGSPPRAASDSPLGSLWPAPHRTAQSAVSNWQLIHQPSKLTHQPPLKITPAGSSEVFWGRRWVTCSVRSAVRTCAQSSGELDRGGPLPWAFGLLAGAATGAGAADARAGAVQGEEGGWGCHASASAAASTRESAPVSPCLKLQHSHSQQGVVGWSKNNKAVEAQRPSADGWSPLGRQEL